MTRYWEPSDPPEALMDWASSNAEEAQKELWEGISMLAQYGHESGELVVSISNFDFDDEGHDPLFWKTVPMSELIEHVSELSRDEIRWYAEQFESLARKIRAMEVSADQ